MRAHAWMGRMEAVGSLVAGVMLANFGCGGDGEGPAPLEELVTATGEGGEGCAAAQHSGSAEPWSASGVFEVPEGAELLVIGSAAALANADLQGVRVTLASPGRAETVTLTGGSVALTGLEGRDAASAADPALEAWLEDTLLLDLPSAATEEDWETLFLRYSGADPEHPLADLPEGVSEAIDAIATDSASWRNAVAQGTAGPGGARPSDGVLVYGPRAGTWSIEVSVEAGAGAFRIMTWVQPAGGERDAIDHVAQALAAKTGEASGALALATGAIGSGEGEDPGGTWALEQFRYPPPGTPEFWRAQAIDISYKVVQWLTLRGLFTKAIDVVLKFAGVEALVAVGLVKDNLKTLAIFVVATVYREILRYSAVADLWFWRLAYCFQGPDYYFQIFNLGKIVEVAGFESYTWKHPDIFLRLNDFEEIRLVGGNMVRERVPRERWGLFSPFDAPKVAKWSIAPSGLALLKVSGEKDGDCTVETKLGDTPPGEGVLTVVVATQPAKATFPVRVAAAIVLEPETARVGAGASVTLTATGHESLAGPFVFAWESGALYGRIEDDQGHAGAAFESDQPSVRYVANDDAHDNANDWVSVTVYEVSGGTRTKLGESVAAIVIRKMQPRCKVTIATYDAPVGWTGPETPVDVECELDTGVYVIDPASIAGCMTTQLCHLQCLGWEDPSESEITIYWHTYDAEGELTGGNYCGSPWYGAESCDAHIEWLTRACGENRCDADAVIGSCSACNCACGGGNCYPWHGPGKIVFHGVPNLPCTDTAKCYYDKMPGKAAGSYGFELVACSSVDNELPNCPGNVPGRD